MPEPRMVSIPRCLIVGWAVVGLGVACGNGRSAIAQTPAAQVASADPSTFTAPPAPPNPDDPGKKEFSVSSVPSLVYWTVRDPMTGARLAGLSTDPSAKNQNLVVQPKPDEEPYIAIFVSLTFTYDSLRPKKYLVEVPIPLDKECYTIPVDEFNKVLSRLMADINSALPQNFDPKTLLDLKDSVIIGVTSIKSVVPPVPFAKDQKTTYKLGVAKANISKTMTRTHIFSPDETPH
jgi:hypothetical protein